MKRYKLYKCDNGKYYGGPQRSCLFCKHCTDLYWDYTNGPYMFICELGLGPAVNCKNFEEDLEDPDILYVEENI